MLDFVGFLTMLLLTILVAFIIRWIRIIKINSNENVVQNQRIIYLLEKIERDSNEK